MQIAQIAPLTEAIPPKLYGGTERVISWLSDELVALGHDVVLFASGDSRTSANLEACWPKALRLDGSVRDPNALQASEGCAGAARSRPRAARGGDDAFSRERVDHFGELGAALVPSIVFEPTLRNTAHLEPFAADRNAPAWDVDGGLVFVGYVKNGIA